MKCLIVAAGQGARFGDQHPLKPLIPVCGTPLIDHVIDRACRAGIDDFVVVSGYQGDTLRAHLDELSARLGLRLTHVVNQAWHRANGVSLSAAQGQLTEPFLLTMCDHLIDPGLLRDLARAPREPDSVTLAVDFDLATPFADPADVTRVLCAEGRILRIGKSISQFNGYDTGVFLCSPIIFNAAAQSQSRGDDSISGAMTVLAASGRAHAHDIGERIWIDVDDAAALQTAERLLASGQL